MSHIGKDGISAEQKFWNNEVVVERLLRFLDAESTLYLAQVHRLTLRILQQYKSVWVKFIKQSCPYGENRNWPLQETDVKRKRTLVGYLVGILKMFDVDKSRQLELELLGLLCSRFPAVPPYRPGPGEDVRNSYRDQRALVRCSYHNESHMISPLGLLLQEDVESGLGTSEQMIEGVWVRTLNQPLLSSLSSRASRQREPLALVDAFVLGLNDEGCADALAHLAKNCTQMKVEDLDVRGKIGRDGWAALAEALRSGVLFPRFSCVDTSREALTEAREEDLRTIWVAKVGAGEGWNGPWETQDSISKHVRFLWKGPQEVPQGPEDDGWEMLKQIQNMSDDEFHADQYEDEDESEDDEEDQDDDEDIEEEQED